MKKYFSILMSMVLITCLLYGCGKEKAATTSVQVNEKPKATVSGEYTSKGVNKNETVFVEMDADGKIVNTIVTDELEYDGKENIADCSTLENIVNLSGDEAFEQKSNGSLIWENKGEKIKYQGSTTQMPPVTVQVEYYLNGNKVSATQLAGKSGELEIKYTYKNNIESDDFIPVMAITGMTLDSDVFSNVEIDNGKIIEMDKAKVAVGFGMPDLKKSLERNVKNSDKYIKDIEIPEGFTIKAKVTDFSMDMAITAIVTDIDNFNLDDMFDFSEIQQQMNTLQKGADQLVRGTNDLSSGAEKLNKGMTTLKTGIDKLSSGATDLNNGVAKLDKGAGKLKTGLAQAKAGFEDTKEKQGLISGTKTLTAGLKDAKDGVNMLVSNMSSTPDNISIQIEGIMAQVKQATGGAIGTKEALKATVEGINSAVTQGMELKTVLQANGLDANAYYSLLQAYYSVQTLESVKTTFEQQINNSSKDMSTLIKGMDSLYTGSKKLGAGINVLYGGITELYNGADSMESGIGQISDGTNSLKMGTAQLSTGSGELKQGTTQLVDGTNKLQSGAKELNEEGIRKISKLFGKELPQTMDELTEMLNSSDNYSSFTGICEGTTGSVKFIFKTGEIK